MKIQYCSGLRIKRHNFMSHGNLKYTIDEKLVQITFLCVRDACCIIDGLNGRKSFSVAASATAADDAPADDPDDNENKI